LAWKRFQSGSGKALRPLFEAFCERQKHWLDDYALFRALKDSFNDVWQNWPRPLVLRQPEALAQARQGLHEAGGRQQFAQFLYFRQWEQLKHYANAHGVRLIGDVAIFVSPDSADVWVHPELFYLNDERRPTFVAGVPPDYFSATGQRWGNPLYNWDVMKQD